MNINQVLDQMAADISVLSFAEKMFGGLIVTVLSMAIVFIVLVILIGVIKAMDMMMNGKRQEEPEDDMEYIEEYEEEDSSELIAVISAAIASSMGVSESSIQVVNISRSGDMTPAWARNGRVEQIQSRL